MRYIYIEKYGNTNYMDNIIFFQNTKMIKDLRLYCYQYTSIYEI